MEKQFVQVLWLRPWEERENLPTFEEAKMCSLLSQRRTSCTDGGEGYKGLFTLTNSCHFCNALYHDIFMGLESIKK